MTALSSYSIASAAVAAALKALPCESRCCCFVVLQPGVTFKNLQAGTSRTHKWQSTHDHWCARKHGRTQLTQFMTPLWRARWCHWPITVWY